ncbi:MAG: hypothetical protein ACTSRP_12455 [Candidatus Helarchaeota archaeon]
MWQKFSEAEKKLWKAAFKITFDDARWTIKNNKIKIIIRKDTQQNEFSIPINPSTIIHLGEFIDDLRKEIKFAFEPYDFNYLDTIESEAHVDTVAYI